MGELQHGGPKRFRLWQWWMVVYSGLGIAFGIFMAFGSTGPLFAAYNSAIAKALWARADLHEAVARYHPWIFSVLGAVVAGWCVCLFFLSLIPFRRRERWAWVCIALSLLVWAPLATVFSIRFGIYIEAGFNLAAAAGYAVPLAKTYRAFFSGRVHRMLNLNVPKPKK
ncbi:MAG: hypothetical protein ABIL58_08535 [Pseudomonadota bacterium]